MTTVTFLQRGEAWDYRNDTTDPIQPNTILTMGDMVGVAGCLINPGQIGSAHVVGIFNVPKGSVAFTQGEEVYLDDSAQQAVAATAATQTDDGNEGDAAETSAPVRLGRCAFPAAASDTLVAVAINA